MTLDRGIRKLRRHLGRQPLSNPRIISRLPNNLRLFRLSPRLLLPLRLLRLSARHRLLRLAQDPRLLLLHAHLLGRFYPRFRRPLLLVLNIAARLLAALDRLELCRGVRLLVRGLRRLCRKQLELPHSILLVEPCLLGLALEKKLLLYPLGGGALGDAVDRGPFGALGDRVERALGHNRRGLLRVEARLVQRGHQILESARRVARHILVRIVDELLEARDDALIEEDLRPLGIVAQVLERAARVRDHLLVLRVEARQQPKLGAALPQQSLREIGARIDGVGGEVGDEEEGALLDVEVLLREQPREREQPAGLSDHGAESVAVLVVRGGDEVA